MQRITDEQKQSFRDGINYHRRKIGLPDMDFTKNIGPTAYTFFTKLRIAKGVYLKDVSEAVGYSPAEISGYLSGRQSAPADFVEKLAEYFGMLLDEIAEFKSLLKETTTKVEGK